MIRMFLTKLLSIILSTSSLSVSLECGQYTNINDILTERIVGGDMAALGEFPWQVSMQKQTGTRMPTSRFLHQWIPSPGNWPSHGTWGQPAVAAINRQTVAPTKPTPTPPGGWPTPPRRPVPYPPAQSGQTPNKPHPAIQKPSPAIPTVVPQPHPQPTVAPNPHPLPPVPSVTTGRWIHFCGGSIISENWILTAAHCVETLKHSYTPGSVRIVLGTLDWRNTNNGSPQIIAIQRVIVHDGWNRNTGQNDIALLQTSSPIQFQTKKDGSIVVNKVCLSKDSNNEYKGEAMSSGWGYLDKNSRVSPDMLRKVKLPIVDFNSCRNAFSRVITVTQNQVCAGQSPKGNCMGDSGGPLVLKSGKTAIQIGIVSFSIPCAVAGYPDVFTRVSKYIDWINQYTSTTVMG